MSILKQNVEKMFKNCYYKNPSEFLFILHCETYWKRLWVNENFNTISRFSSEIYPPEFKNKIYFGLIHSNRINPIGTPVTLLLNKALNISMRNR